MKTQKDNSIKEIINLPKNTEVEEVVIGSILIDRFAIDKIIGEFNANLFHDFKNKIIASAIIELYKVSIPIDLVTIVQHLIQEGKIDNVGGPKYVSSLTSRAASSINIEHHIRILQEEALKRNLIVIGSTAINKSMDPTEDVFDVFNETQSNLDNALKKVINYEIKQAGDIHTEILKKSYDMINTKQKSGVATGLNALDNVTNGWQDSDLIILAGRPAMGKTAIAISMCMYPSLELGNSVAIFSLEMSNEQLVSRMQSYLSGVNVSKIVKKQLSEDEITLISTRAKKMVDSKIFVDDTPNISLLDLKGKSRKLKKEHDIKLIVVDYLQLMRSGLKINSREQEIAEISRGLKSLAKELNIPVIALSQLSRTVESRADKKPMLQDLRESGQIEQDADMVLFCYRPEYYGIDNYEIGNNTFDANGLFMLIIAKHRNGELGEVPLKFISEQTKITNLDFKSDFDKEEPQNTNRSTALKPNSQFFLDKDAEKHSIFEDNDEEETPF